MKRFFILKNLLFVISIFSLISIAEQTESIKSTEYCTKTDILYYEKDRNQIDNYTNQQCRLDLYYPTNKPDFATVVWFHPGGLVRGARSFPEQLLEKNIAIAAADYRLSPNVTCPEYIEDAAAAVAWVFKNINNFGGNPRLIFVSGHSAGGYLASMVGLDKKWLMNHSVDANNIAGIISLSGPAITPPTIRKEKGISSERPVIDEFAVLYHVRADAPPYMSITGDKNLELMGRYEENAYLIRMLNVVGHEHNVLYEIQGYSHSRMAVPAFPILLEHLNLIVKYNNSTTLD